MHFFFQLSYLRYIKIFFRICSLEMIVFLKLFKIYVLGETKTIVLFVIFRVLSSKIKLKIVNSFVYM